MLHWYPEMQEQGGPGLESFVEIKTNQGTGFGKWIDLQYKVQFSTGVNFFTS
jgi:hypothetical protein